MPKNLHYFHNLRNVINHFHFLHIHFCAGWMFIDSKCHYYSLTLSMPLKQWMSAMVLPDLHKDKPLLPWFLPQENGSAGVQVSVQLDLWSAAVIFDPYPCEIRAVKSNCEIYIVNMRQGPFSQLVDDCCFKNLQQIFSEIEVSIKYYRMWKVHFKPLKCYCFIWVSTFLNQDEWNQPPPEFCICSKIWVTSRSTWDEDIIYECLQTVIYRRMVVENKCTTREIATILPQWTLQLWPFQDALKDFKAAVWLLHTNIQYLSQKIK